MERQLAIKRFHAAVLAQPEASAKLQAACRSYGGLDHPRIARLSELGVASGDTFTATELVPGLDLGRLRAMTQDSGDPLPSGGVMQLLSAAARAVGYAHGRGVNHWGVSPSNVIATPDGDVKVTDFGILTCRLPARPSTDETLMLRLPYLAPEQMLGEPLSAATDVFALGVLAYELIGGSRPFNGATPTELEHAIVSGRPAPLELPRPIARVIDRCLARSPFERFPDARSLADALDAALRLAPLTGTRREVGDRVRAALDHLTRINEQQLSGALSFSVPTPPPRPPRPSLPSVSSVSSVSSSSSLPPLPLPVPTSTPPPTPMAALPPPPRRPFRQTSLPPLVAPPTDPGDEATKPRPAHLRVETDLNLGDDSERIEPLWPPTEKIQLIREDGSARGGPALPTGRSPFAIATPPLPPVSSALVPTFAPPPPMAMPVVVVPRRRGVAIVAGAVVLAGAAIAVAYLVTRGQPDEPIGGAGTVIAAEIDAAAPVGVAAPVAPLDAGRRTETSTPTPTPAATNQLTITSTPSGARVFLDGADQGVTPLSLAASTDEHTLAIVLAGHALHLATVGGAGTHDATLEPIARRTGKGGIKVRCNDHRRYYVFIDGAATGELCPTERIPVELGKHAVEIYDLTTEVRRTLPTLRVVQTRRSTRIKAD